MDVCFNTDFFFFHLCKMDNHNQTTSNQVNAPN